MQEVFEALGLGLSELLAALVDSENRRIRWFACAVIMLLAGGLFAVVALLAS